MAIPEPVSAYPDPLIRVYAQAWNHIISEQARIFGVGRQARRAARLRELQTAVEVQMAALDAASRGWVRTQFPQIYTAGAQAGARLAGEAFDTWTVFHRQAVDLLAKDTFNDMLTATTYVREDVKRVIRNAAKIQSELAATTGRTAVERGRKLREVLSREGIHAIQYRNGARHGLAEYSNMVLRTKTAVAYNEGTLNAAAEFGVKYFQIFDGFGCGLTAHAVGEIANGMIVTEEVARSFPIAHPNCQRSFGAVPDRKKASKGGGKPGAKTPPKKSEITAVPEPKPPLKGAKARAMLDETFDDFRKEDFIDVGMNDRESWQFAYRRYMGSGYSSINTALRRGDLQHQHPDLSKWVDNIDSHMKPIPEPVQVHRGFFSEEGDDDNPINRLRDMLDAGDHDQVIGSELHEPGYMSTSLDPKVAGGFGDMNVTITAPAGTRGGAAYRFNGLESEFIIARGHKLVFSGARRANPGEKAVWYLDATVEPI